RRLLRQRGDAPPRPADRRPRPRPRADAGGALGRISRAQAVAPGEGPAFGHGAPGRAGRGAAACSVGFAAFGDSGGYWSRGDSPRGAGRGEMLSARPSRLLVFTLALAAGAGASAFPGATEAVRVRSAGPQALEITVQAGAFADPARLRAEVMRSAAAA